MSDKTSITKCSPFFFSSVLSSFIGCGGDGGGGEVALLSCYVWPWGYVAVSDGNQLFCIGNKCLVTIAQFFLNVVRVGLELAS